ncbi:MAG: heparinase II/III family protein [Acidobacteria bacterium]|nr:heparinase II/III family protein [Acidobacteriota bacterium]
MQRVESALRRELASLGEAARRAAFARLPRLASAMLTMEARGLGAPSVPHFFARDLVRISPTLSDDLLELYGRSEQVLANRFGFFGETEEFDAEIAWEPRRGRAWQVELHSFDYALDLALTFRISGDERYARHLRYLLAAWIASNPPGRAVGWTPLALARRIRNWVLAADLSRDSFQADTDFPRLFGSSLAQQVAYLAWQASWLEDRRARLVTSRALLLASRTFSSGRGVEVGQTAHALLAEAFDDGFESFPDHPQPLRQFELAAACCDHVLFGDADDGTNWAREQLQGALESLEGMLHPDGTVAMFGHEPLPSAEALTTLFALGAAELGVPQWKDLAGGEFGILPYMILGESGRCRFDELPHESWHADTRLHSESGICRLGDGNSSAMLICALPRNSPHDHRDLFSFELTVYGQRTVVDSGIYRPAVGADQEDLAAARGHNVLLVDGSLPKTDSGSGIQSRPVDESDKVQGLWLKLGRDVRPEELSPPESRGRPPGPRGSIEHQRGCFLVEGRFWVVLDRLAGSGVHRVESLIHFYPAFSLEVVGRMVVAKSGAVAVRVQPLSCGDANNPSVAKCRTEAPGWYSPAPGTRYPSQISVFEWDQAALPCVLGYVIGNKPDDLTNAQVCVASTGEILLDLDGMGYALGIL